MGGSEQEVEGWSTVVSGGVEGREDEIETPLLPNKLKGNVYIMQNNPPELQLLVAASGEGVNVKLVGTVHLDEATGRLTTTFNGRKSTPEAPFTEFKLTFSGGAQAALVTPPGVGCTRRRADFTPWSSPLVEDAVDRSFAITARPGRQRRATGGPLPFQPTMTAGSTTDQAGGYTDFSMLLQRGDGQQRVGKLQFKTPEGLLGMIAASRSAPNRRPAQGTAPASSQIGHTVVGRSRPVSVVHPASRVAPPAPIYMTGRYEGAPFGLSIVVPIVAGPFNLGTMSCGRRSKWIGIPRS